MTEKAILTSCSNKFFPGVLNLIGSIKNTYPKHPPIFVYDQGILPLFRKELELTEGVTVIPIPPFCPHFKSCYTWKTYIFAHPPARLNFYMDSGLQVLAPLDSVFDQIEKDDYLAIAQNLPLERTTPEEYKELFNIEERFYKETYITAGIFGFKTNSKITGVLNDLYEAGIAGLCLGFSPKEVWRNKGKNKNSFIRKCELFRFDTSVLTLLMRKELKDFIVSPQDKYELGTLLNTPDQLIFNARLKYIKKENIQPKLLINKIYIPLFLFLKRFINQIKK